jgi:hypothetical protein
MSPNIDSSQLLRALGAQIQPQGLGLPASTSAADASQLTEGPSFGQMLQQAQGGQVSSGIPIRVLRQAGVDLNSSQLTRLADAGDRAEAAGASRALVMIDGMVLTMDVPQRTITGKADTSSTKVLNGVDAVVTCAAQPGDIPNQAAPPTGATNASLLKILAGRQPGGETSS